MLAFLRDNLGTLVVALVVFVIFALIVGKGIVNKKNHKGGCSCGCSGCPSSGMCHPNGDQ
jgi:hypothetical protein